MVLREVPLGESEIETYLNEQVLGEIVSEVVNSIHALATTYSFRPPIQLPPMILLHTV